MVRVGPEVRVDPVVWLVRVGPEVLHQRGRELELLQRSPGTLLFPPHPRQHYRERSPLIGPALKFPLPQSPPLLLMSLLPFEHRLDPNALPPNGKIEIGPRKAIQHYGKVAIRV